MASNPSKSGERTKQSCNPPCSGDVGINKWSCFFASAPKVPFFGTCKKGTFAKSARFHVAKNGASGAETKKPRPLFVANYPPK